MGVLVGTSLVVIIPEGVETLYSSSLAGNVQFRRASIDWLSTEISHKSQVITRGKAGDGEPIMPVRPVPESPKDPAMTTTLPEKVGILQEEGERKVAGNSAQGDKTSNGHYNSPHAWVGVALIAGFILMFLIDKLPQYAASSKATYQPYHISLNDLSNGLRRPLSPNRDSNAGEFLHDTTTDQELSRNYATTTGLVIHAAADGVALGASSSSANAGLSLIIFLAIMVHKAPAAFGLTSILLKQGLSKRTARAHLVLFSLAAPIGAVLTWLLAHTLGAGMIANAQTTTWWTGILLLFSAGTFLYVAMHTLQEVNSSRDMQLKGHLKGIGENPDTISPPQNGSPQYIIAAVLGMLLPLFLQMGHGH